MIQKSTLKKALWLCNLIFFYFIFSLMHYKKFGIFVPTDNYFYLFIIFLFFWIVFTIYYKKIDICIEKPMRLSITNNLLVITFKSPFCSNNFINI